MAPSLMTIKKYCPGFRTASFKTVSLCILALSATSCNEVDVQPIESAVSVCQDYFEACINPILTQPLVSAGGGPGTFSCSSEGCHNVTTGAAGSFKIFPRAARGSVEIRANFLSAKSFVNISDPALSKLLLEPLAGVSSVVGGHGGGDIFLDPSDSRYQEIFLWISTPQESATEACPNLDWFPNDGSKRCNSDG